MTRRKPGKAPATGRGQQSDIDRVLTSVAGVKTTIQTRHSGILPPPEMLREYEKIIPNAGERLLSLVEEEQKHRHSYEKHIVDSAVQDAKDGRRAHFRGDIIAVVIFVICTTLGMTLLLLDRNPLIAGALLGAPLIGAIASFLLARKGFTLLRRPDKNIKECGPDSAS
jgi:uncharacterized membrane protein